MQVWSVELVVIVREDDSPRKYKIEKKLKYKRPAQIIITLEEEDAQGSDQNREST